MAERARAEQESADSHLRSSNEVTGYDIAARDGHIGHVKSSPPYDREKQLEVDDDRRLARHYAGCI